MRIRRKIDAEGTRIKSGEVLELYPTLVVPSGSVLEFHFHARLYRPITTTKLRTLFARRFARAIGIATDESQPGIFDERAAPFLADSVKGRSVYVHLHGTITSIGETGADGIVRRVIRIPHAEFQAKTIRIAVEPGSEDVGSEGGSVLAEFPIVSLPAGGHSVISDIDDTLKHSMVHDKRATVAAAFLRPYRAIAGMPELFAKLGDETTSFHYLSASPWQLFRPLLEFAGREKYPAGTWHLRKLRFKDRSMFSLTMASHRSKRKSLRDLIVLLGKRPVILVGDSSEGDALLYAEIQREFPDRVLQILIRDTSHHKVFPKVLEGLNPRQRRKWQIFTDPSDIRLDFMGSSGKKPRRRV